MSVSILQGDCRATLATLPACSVNCCVTSPPYFGLRSYLPERHPLKYLEMGMEESPDEFVAELVGVFREVRRVLRDDGTLWLNIGDSYASNAGGYSETGSRGATSMPSIGAGTMAAVQKGRRRKPLEGLKPKDLIGIPWMLAFALRADGWYLRQDIIWHKPNAMPESTKDRCTKAHEHLFLLSKSGRYHFDNEAITEPASYPEGAGNTKAYDVSGQRDGENANIGGGIHKIGGRETRNKRSVWTVPTAPYKEAHFATFPPALIEPCILAGCPAGGTVLDPFGGAGTTGLVADRLQRNAILCELHPDYPDMARARIDKDRGGGLLDAMEAA